jgi:uncharacterized protein YgfB (UPF0149 family)
MSDQETGELLVATDGHEGAAAHQGSFMGLACAVGEQAPAQWQALVLADWSGERNSEEARKTLVRGASFWLQALNEGQLGYALLLGDDDVPLEARTAALGQWCQGFLFGLAQGGIQDYAALPGDVGEFVDDLLAISRAVADGDTNEDERAYFEICEYVRVGTQLAFDELAALHARPAGGTH